MRLLNSKTKAKTSNKSFRMSVGFETFDMYIGLWIVMGLKHQSNVRNYWRKIYGNEFIKSTIFPRDQCVFMVMGGYGEYSK